MPGREGEENIITSKLNKNQQTTNSVIYEPAIKLIQAARIISAG